MKERYEPIIFLYKGGGIGSYRWIQDKGDWYFILSFIGKLYSIEINTWIIKG